MNSFKKNIFKSTNETSGVIAYDFTFTDIGRTTSEASCSDSVYILTLYADSPILVDVITLYTDIGLTTPYVGGDLWIKEVTSNSSYLIDNIGNIQDSISCLPPSTTGQYSSTSTANPSLGCGLVANNACWFNILGTKIYLNAELTSPVVGGNLHYKIIKEGVAYSAQIENDGTLNIFSTCP